MICVSLPLYLFCLITVYIVFIDCFLNFKWNVIIDYGNKSCVGVLHNAKHETALLFDATSAKEILDKKINVKDTVLGLHLLVK